MWSFKVSHVDSPNCSSLQTLGTAGTSKPLAPPIGSRASLPQQGTCKSGLQNALLSYFLVNNANFSHYHWEQLKQIDISASYASPGNLMLLRLNNGKQILVFARVTSLRDISAEMLEAKMVFAGLNWFCHVAN